MLRNAYGLESPPVGEASRLDLRTYEDAERRLLTSSSAGAARRRALTRRRRVGARAPDAAPAGAATSPGASRSSISSARAPAASTSSSCSVRGGEPAPARLVVAVLDDDARRLLDERGARLLRPDQVSRDRYLFYTACTRPLEAPLLVREAATDDGSPREPSPFWDEVQAVFDSEDVRRWTRRRRFRHSRGRSTARPPSASGCGRSQSSPRMTQAAPTRSRAPTAGSGGSSAQRARSAGRTKLTHPLVLEQLGAKTTFNVTELERFADCSSAWFVERFLSPRSIDAEVDAKLRGSVAQQRALQVLHAHAKELGVEQLDERIVDDAVRLMRACLDEALQGVRMDMTEMQARELDQSLWRDLEAVVRSECESELTLVPRRFEVLFGGERAAPELQRGLDLGDGLTLSGKIDRIDVDPFGARGIVQDYKSGKHAHSAREIESELRLQIPLYMLVLRDLVGLEPLGGLYRPLAGERKARGLLRRPRATRSRATRGTTTSRKRPSGRGRPRARDGARARRPHSRRRRRARP